MSTDLGKSSREPAAPTRRVSVAVIVSLVGGTLAAMFWLWVTGEGSATAQRPHHVPVAVVGPPSAVAQLSRALSRGDAFRVVHAADEAAALDLVKHRRADAVVNLDTHELQTAQAASMLTGPALEQALSAPQAGLQLRPVELRPLRSGDPTGLGLLFIPMACVLAGLINGVRYGLMKKRPDSLADAGVRTLLVLATAPVTALLIALVADGVLGYGGSDLLTIWGWGALLNAVAMACAMAFVSALGVAGAALAAIPILLFGVPSAPAPTAWNWHSGVFRVFGPYAPFGVTSDGIRRGIFFPDTSPARDLVVMGLWLVVPIALLFVLGWWSQSRAVATSGADDDGGAAARAKAPGEPRAALA